MSHFDIGFSSGMDKAASEMSKVAVDPVHAAGLAFAGKQLLSNTLSRNAMRTSAGRRIAQELAGFGARAGAAGRALPGRVTREGLAMVGSPDAVGLVENAHRAASRIGSRTAEHLSEFARHPMISKHFPDAHDAQRFVAGIPMSSTGARRVADYGLTPVSQVGKDIAEKGRAAAGSIKDKLKGLLSRKVVHQAIDTATT